MGRLFQSVPRQVGLNWPVQDFRGVSSRCPKPCPSPSDCGIDMLMGVPLRRVSYTLSDLASLVFVVVVSSRTSQGPEPAVAAAHLVIHVLSFSWCVLWKSSQVWQPPGAPDRVLQGQHGPSLGSSVVLGFGPQPAAAPDRRRRVFTAVCGSSWSPHETRRPAGPSTSTPCASGPAPDHLTFS